MEVEIATPAARLVIYNVSSRASAFSANRSARSKARAEADRQRQVALQLHHFDAAENTFVPVDRRIVTSIVAALSYYADQANPTESELSLSGQQCMELAEQLARGHELYD